MNVLTPWFSILGLICCIVSLGCTVPPNQISAKPGQITTTTATFQISPTFSPSTTTPTPTQLITPTPSPTLSSIPEVRILQTALREYYCWQGGTVTIKESNYSYGCAPAAGHSTSISLTQFADTAEAQANFASTNGDQPVGDFHGCPLAKWEQPYYGGQRQTWVWQAERWLITISAFDDTLYKIAPGPEQVSENIYQAAVALGLFARCE